MGHKKKRRIRIHREGRGLIASLTLLIFVINVPLFMYMPTWVGAITLLLSATLLIFVTYFFRNPTRILEVGDENFLIAPADGRVVVIEPTEENEYFHKKRLQVSIFMSPLNVHANWYPIEGTVLVSEHQDGRHQGAWLPKSSTENERSMVIIKTPEGEEVMVRQIAGACARRIVTYPKVGDQCHINQHLGFIKLGSRVDVYLPVNSLICAKINQKTKADITILAKLP